MSLSQPRADDLLWVRFACHKVERNGDSCSSQELRRAFGDASESRQGVRWKRTRIYHYTSAACELGLLKASKGRFLLTNKGRQFVSVCESKELLEPLTDPEKKIVSSSLLSYPAVADYLSLFMPDSATPTTIEDFSARGRSIKIKGLGSNTYELESAAGTKRRVTRSEKAYLAWSLPSWLKDLDLIDDLYVETPASFMLLGPETRLLYPLRSPTPSLGELSTLIVGLARTSGCEYSVHHIPSLLVDVCPPSGLRRRDFLEALVALHMKEPSVFHLEMVSRLRVDHRWQTRGGYENMPTLDGIQRSHLGVLLGGTHRGTTPNDTPAERTST